MASLMDSFEQQYATLTADITSKTSRLPNLSGVERKLLISQVERQMEEAHELLEQMDLEVKGMPPASRQKYQIRLKSYVAELSLLDKELRARIVHRDENLARDELFEGDYVKDDQKQRLLDNTERLERSSRQLEGGYKLAVEAEQIGAQILTDLSSQRETIKKSKSRVQETNYDLGKSSRIVNGMIRGLKQQKMVLYAVAAVVVLSIILAIYFTIRKHS
ncbi:vesicle transport through interaction with t-SNAREs homolog 1A-like isoform X2 [Stegodyphus dumicola]|uniref:vesicle transport through interaction with t-SNAREs homolog 1A-like isoform X2 n=1 Tax=Stegodyphus dumicola TaxID=202533 RepID=UPI0015AA3037|nr:vesicle transport through interaction with t-SNAREs homolog 1A-like isoform X2 [Stegodyphus dumicola]